MYPTIAVVDEEALTARGLQVDMNARRIGIECNPIKLSRINRGLRGLRRGIAIDGDVGGITAVLRQMLAAKFRVFNPLILRVGPDAANDPNRAVVLLFA